MLLKCQMLIKKRNRNSKLYKNKIVAVAISEYLINFFLICLKLIKFYQIFL